jgi:CRP-like cAMP-binding protein
MTPRTSTRSSLAPSCSTSLLPDGRRQVVEVLGPGDLFGFDMDTYHDCSAETLVATTALVFSRRDVEASTAAQSHLTRCAMQQVYAMHDHAVLLGRKSAYERVASFLMRFVPDRGTTHCKGPDDEVAMKEQSNST